ncbi:MAG: ergothioneine biosynthesis protein EgtB [Acetobacteraceae bacterium]|nr:ergothioneine biosynthesis protein EgtB [Acetobacteraceae bacterium]
MLERYQAVRDRSERLARPLSAEDQAIQSMPDASPAKWHLGHTTWFFEQFLLGRFAPEHRPVDPRYAFLFNSYYEAAGPRHARPRRGMLTRPSAAEVLEYRHAVDGAMRGLLARNLPEEAGFLLELGLNHEEQHQELLLTDALHALAQNPLRPAYDEAWVAPPALPASCRYLDGPAGLVSIGHDPGAGFAFDNEGPRHRVWLEPYRIGSRPVSNGEWLEFMAAGGYRDPLLWMSDGWAARCEQGWEAPLYWEQDAEGAWRQFTPGGLRPVEPAAAVRHVSWYEADAFARWAGRRLPTEAEWEAAATTLPGLAALEGDVWQWTGSAYRPYPGFRAWAGAVGEYNGKFMVNQMVLRGGSLATPPGHTRPGYRNFFPPDARWQCTGMRLAEDA